LRAMDHTALFNDARLLAAATASLLEELEELPRGAAASGRLQEDVARNVNQLRMKLTSLQNTSAASPFLASDRAWQEQLRHLGGTVAGLHSDLQRRIGRADASARETREREELLSGASRQEAMEKMQLLADEQRSLAKSDRMVDDMFSQGKGVLGELSSQRSRLKGVRTRMLDVANTLGLSQTLIRAIERRQNLDAWLVYGGMAATLGLVYCLYSWRFGPPPPPPPQQPT